MTTPDPASTRRLRILSDAPAPEQRPGRRRVGTDDDVEVTPEQAAAFAARVAEGDQIAVTHTLEQMGAAQVRALAIALATQVNATQVNATQVNAAQTNEGQPSEAEIADGEVCEVGPDGICTVAVAAAAQAFGATRDALLSADRHRAVTDARAVAMTAARRGGMTLTSIAAFFGKDHTRVMYAQSKVANNPRLNSACARIVEQLEHHSSQPGAIPARHDAETSEAGRGDVLQLAALDESRPAASAARARDEDQARRLSPAPPRP